MNLFFWLEVFAAVVLVGMLASSWLALRRSGETSDPLPSLQAAALLVGTLIPALALVVLWGRRMAIRRAGDSSARLHVQLVFFFSLGRRRADAACGGVRVDPLPVGRRVLVFQQQSRDP